MSNPSVQSSPATGGAARPRPRRRQLNPRAAAVLVAVLLVGVPAFFFVRIYQVRHKSSALLAEAKTLLARKPPEAGTALTYLNEYLAQNPGDIDALDLKGKVLFDLVRTYDQAVAAIKPNELVVLSDNPPTPPGGRRHLKRVEARRRLLQLNLATLQLQTALALAEDLVHSDNAEAEDYRLMGRTLVALANDNVATVKVGTKDVDIWAEAIRNFEEAQRREPGDVGGARDLATLYRDRGSDRKAGEKKGEKVLDQLLEASPSPARKAAARLARWEFFAGAGALADDPQVAAELDTRARAELEEAVRLQPADPDVLIRAASDALRRGDTELARRRVEAIPQNVRRDVKMTIEGHVSLLEQKIDEAIQDFREGLKATGGTNEGLTWRLALVLLRLGRPDDARPLIEQYHRLTDRKASGPTPAAIFLDGLMALKQNQPKKAIELLESIRLKVNEASTPGGKATTGIDQSLEAEVAQGLGQAYEADGREAEALEAYRRAEKVIRTSRGLKWADPWVGAANLLTQANRLDEAATELEDGLVTLPGDPTLLVNLSRIRLVQQTRQPREKQSWDDVRKTLDMARKAAPASADLIKLQAAYLLTAGKPQEAERLLAAATDPKHHARNPDLWATRATILVQLGKPEDALRVLDEGAAVVGDQAILRIARANVLFKQGAEKAAYEVLAQGEHTVPREQRPVVLRALGDLHRRRNDPASARKAYAEWAQIQPDDPQPQLLVLDLALAAQDQAGIRSAVAALHKMGGMASELADALVLLKGQADGEADRTRRLAEADRAIKKIIAEAPGKPTGYLLQGQLREQQGRVDEAIAAYREARAHNGGGEALRHLFGLLARQRRFKDLRTLRAELNSGELSPELDQIAAGIAMMLGEKREVQDLIKQAVDANPQGIDTRLWQVRMLNALGKPKDAEQILRALIKQRPEALDPRFSLMMLQLSQQQYQAAAETVEQIRSQAKVDQPEFVWAVCYAAIGNQAKASEYYKAALQNWPDDQAVRRQAIGYFVKSGRPEEAEAALRDVLKRRPGNAWATRELAQLLSAKPNDPASWRESLELVGARPGNSDTAEDRLVRAMVLARAPDPARRPEAIPLLEALVADSPGAVALMAHDLLARVYADAGQSAKALEHAEATARDNSPGAIAFYIDLLLRDKKLDEALKQVDRLAKIEPDSLRVLGLRARVLQAQGKAQEAASMLEDRAAALEREAPADDDAQVRRIVDILVAIDQLDAAERVARHLAQSRPRAANVLAAVLARRGKMAEALAACQVAADAGNGLEAGSTATLLVAGLPPGPDAEARLKEADAVLDKALKQNPGHFAMLFAKASVQRLLGHYDAAAQLYRSMLERSPDNPVLLNNMAWTLSEDLNKPAEGLDKIDTAIKKTGRLASWLDTRGVILTRLGKLDEAITDLEEAAKASPPSASLYYHLARAYSKAGRNEPFRKYRDLAKKAGLAPAQLQPNERAEAQRLMQ